MRITKYKEKTLIALLRNESISVPELQLKMNLSYTDARSMIDYAIARKWIKIHARGIDYPVIACRFEAVELDADVCNEVFRRLTYDSLKLLYYIGKRFSVTFKDIIEDVDDDEEDMQNAIEKLLKEDLIFKHGENFYCVISRRSIAKIKRNEKGRKNSNPFSLKSFMGE